MLAREGISWGAMAWWVPWRERKAMGIGLPVDGDGWWRTVMGEEVAPQGVSTLRFATGVKEGRLWRPVPPMTAMGIGSWGESVSGT